MRLVYIVDDLESVTAWIDVLVCLYTVASDVDISLDLRLLQFIRSKNPSKHPETKYPKPRHLPIYRCSSGRTNEDLSGQSISSSTSCTYRSSCASSHYGRVYLSAQEYSSPVPG